jgi:hypothetical protein
MFYPKQPRQLRLGKLGGLGKPCSAICSIWNLPHVNILVVKAPQVATFSCKFLKLVTNDHSTQAYVITHVSCKH